MTSNTQPYPFVPSIFDKMWQTSESLLKDISTTKMTQAVVLLSSKGKEYSTIIEDVLTEEKNAEKSLVSELRANDDTEICYILAVWKNGCVDVPSYDFRKMLCRLNIENKNAAIFLMGEAGYHTKPLRVTMANFDFLNEEDDIL